MITPQAALDLFESDDLVGLGMKADAVRKKLHPERIVTYFLAADPASPPASIASIVFNHRDANAQHVHRLQIIREIQERDDSFIAIAPSFDATAAEYLKVLAISRIYLENVPHVQTSWRVGLKVCQIALRFGADDISSPDTSHDAPTEEQLRCLIRDGGFIPKQRDALFRAYSLT